MGLRTDRKIYKKELREWFEKFRNEPYFNWVDRLNFQFKGLQNAEVEDQGSKLQKETSEFDPEEYRALELFFE